MELWVTLQKEIEKFNMFKDNDPFGNRIIVSADWHNILNADPFYKDLTTGLVIITAVALTAGRK